MGESHMALKSMSVEKLQDLSSKVEAAIRQKLIERRHELESELSKLDRVGGDGRRKIGRGAPRGVRGPVAAKYRNPENPAETWAGRGLKPRWLTAAMKSGKKLDDFLIAGAAKASASGKAKGGRRGRKAAK
jgi:DNA-binding protein H-NS